MTLTYEEVKMLYQLIERMYVSYEQPELIQLIRRMRFFIDGMKDIHHE